MSRREDFDNSLWSDPDFLALTHQARMVYIWTWTNPRCGMAGIYKTAPVQAAMETGLTEAEVTAALVELGDARFAFYQGNVLWVRSRAKHLRQKTTQIAKAIRNDLSRIADDHPLKAQFMETYRDHSWLREHIGTEAQVTLTRPVTESQNQSPSKDGHSTVLGTGTGTGKGTGVRGRGLGKGDKFTWPGDRTTTPAATADEARAIDEEFGRRQDRRRAMEELADETGVPLATVMEHVRSIRESGETISVEAVRTRLSVPSPDGAA